MKRKMTMIAICAVCLFLIPLFGADTKDEKQVHSDVKKLTEKLATDVDKLVATMAEYVCRPLKAKTEAWSEG